MSTEFTESKDASSLHTLVLITLLTWPVIDLTNGILVMNVKLVTDASAHLRHSGFLPIAMAREEELRSMFLVARSWLDLAH